MSKTYRYYGTVESRGRNYRQLPNPKPKANLGEGRSAKNLEQQLADVGVKTGQNIPWYKDVWGLEIHAQKAVKNKNFDDFKEFSDEQIHQMYPDDPQLANYLINGKNSTFMRESKSLNEDAIAYEKKYGKVSDADVDSIIDAAIQKRDKKSLEDMSILTNDAIERWIDRHPSNSGFGKTGNILKSWRDEPAKYIIEPEATDVNNASKPAETKADQSAATEKLSEGATADAWFADMLSPDKLAAERAAFEKQKALEKQEAQDVQAALERQAAQDMVDNSKPAKMNEQPAWVTTPWRETMYRLGDRTPEINPPEKYEPSSNNLWDFPELAVSRNSSRIPNYLKDAYERKVERDIRKQESRMDLDNINPRTGHVMSPARYNSFSSIYGRNAPLIHGLTAAGVLGLGGLGLYGKYALQNNDEELAQTQVPYRMETEPVSVNVPQVEPTPEQQFALESTSPFDYAKIANLFDLYDKYGSPNSPIKIDPVKDKELIDEAMSDFESPQNPPAVGTNINDANLVIPDADEAPEEINDAMLDAKPGSFWKATRDVVSPKVNAVKNAAQNVFGRTLARSKTAPKTSNGSASNIQDTSNGPVVLNTPRQRKTNSRVNYQDAAKQMLGASEAVNNLAREAYNFNKQQSSQKPEAALAQSLLRGDTGLQQYRYQSLLNSGLRGMTPDEAIRSGLLTPEQVQVLMRGPY